METSSLKASAYAFAVKQAINYARRDPDKNLIKVLNLVEKADVKKANQVTYNNLRKSLKDPNNNWTRFIKNILFNTDPKVLDKFVPVLLNIALNSFAVRTENIEKYKCNIPWAILMDPTAACNLHCKGCWAAEYGHALKLSLDEMRSIVKQGRALGTHFYMLTGGEPLIRKDDIVTLAKENPECTFLIYTNATLVDEKLCCDIKKCGNITLALSIEGTKESNDDRRGEGSYSRTLKAMELLKREKILFGISICYTRKNVEAVTDDAFLDKMVDLGVKYALYFNYMPVGHDADKELIPTPMQRKYMYYFMKKMRNGKTGKPIFVMDFQDDGEYVGGCIAGGRNYFHVNSNGDIEPCVFIHYSDSNIRTDTLLDALRKPLFMAYRKGQPFNDNHLRPCPMLENPEKLRAIIKETGAKSTDLIVSEDVETLCARCDEFSKEWQPVADEIWRTNKHPKTHTQYYRDSR